MTKKILTAAILSLSLFACSKDSGFADLKKEACACKTAECAKAVNAKADKAMGAITSEPSEADMKAVLEMSACLAPLMTGE